MLLRSLRLRNYRAVQSAEISFDQTTILIGENDCGRSSLMEAIALALGWNGGECGFRFEPFHFHRPLGQSATAAPSIAIELDFCEEAKGEWDGPGFETLRTVLPDVVTRDRCFHLEVTHTPEGATSWTFRAGTSQPVVNDHGLLPWLRRAMPVFWLTEGMAVRSDSHKLQHPDEPSRLLAEQVSEQYRDLLEGTTLDVYQGIERGSFAATQMLQARSSLLTDPAAAGTVLEEMTGRHKSRKSQATSEGSGTFGTAAQKIGLLLLVGALLRSGGTRVERGMSPLTLIENPEAHLHPTTLASIWGVIERVAGQKIVATHSGTLLASARLSSVRRLTRHGGVVKEWRVPEGSLDADELRRYTYHLRSRRAAANFARCWLFVEGETEFWLMGELARVCGYNFASEGVSCVEFAQCGLDSLIKVAHHLGIEWHLLSDGDSAGQTYARSARRHQEADGEQRITDFGGAGYRAHILAIRIRRHFPESRLSPPHGGRPVAKSRSGKDCHSPCDRPPLEAGARDSAIGCRGRSRPRWSPGASAECDRDLCSPGSGCLAGGRCGARVEMSLDAARRSASQECVRHSTGMSGRVL